jgi:hypothetical protein
MKLAAAALCALLAACSTCLPRAKVLRTGGKIDGALVGVICSTDKLERKVIR